MLQFAVYLSLLIPTILLLRQVLIVYMYVFMYHCVCACVIVCDVLSLAKKLYLHWSSSYPAVKWVTVEAVNYVGTLAVPGEANANCPCFI